MRDRAMWDIKSESNAADCADSLPLPARRPRPMKSHERQFR